MARFPPIGFIFDILYFLSPHAPPAVKIGPKIWIVVMFGVETVFINPQHCEQCRQSVLMPKVDCYPVVHKPVHQVLHQRAGYQAVQFVLFVP